MALGLKERKSRGVAIAYISGIRGFPDSEGKPLWEVRFGNGQQPSSSNHHHQGKHPSPRGKTLNPSSCGNQKRQYANTENEGCPSDVTGTHHCSFSLSRQYVQPNFLEIASFIPVLLIDQFSKVSCPKQALTDWD